MLRLHCTIKQNNIFMVLKNVLFQFFDEVKIEDARVTEFSAKTGMPSPYQILCECLRR